MSGLLAAQSSGTDPAGATAPTSATSSYQSLGQLFQREAQAISFSVAPLRIASLLGLLLAAGAFIFGVQILIETVVFGEKVPGYPSVVVGLMVLGGVQLIMIGIMGEYIGKILSEQKARPIYFVAEHSVKAADREAGATRTAAE